MTAYVDSSDQSKQAMRNSLTASLLALGVMMKDDSLTSAAAAKQIEANNDEPRRMINELVVIDIGTSVMDRCWAEPPVLAAGYNGVRHSRNRKRNPDRWR